LIERHVLAGQRLLLGADGHLSANFRSRLKLEANAVDRRIRVYDDARAWRRRPIANCLPRSRRTGRDRHGTRIGHRGPFRTDSRNPSNWYPAPSASTWIPSAGRPSANRTRPRQRHRAKQFHRDFIFSALGIELDPFRRAIARVIFLCQKVTRPAFHTGSQSNTATPSAPVFAWEGGHAGDIQHVFGFSTRSAFFLNVPGISSIPARAGPRDRPA